jgi:putative GTP pyrophosphokinase
MAMDFWATLEHEIKYKSNGKISDKVSKELVAYSKIINKIDNRLMKLHNKKYKGNIRLS